MSFLMVRKSAPAKATDAYIDDITYKYKVGDKIKTPDGVGIVQKKTYTNSGKPAYEVKLDKGGIVVHVEQSVSAANDSAAAQDAGAFPLAEKASRIVKGIMSQVKRVEDEAEAVFRNAKTAEEKNAAQRDAVAIHNIMEKLEIAASYA